MDVRIQAWLGDWHTKTLRCILLLVLILFAVSCATEYDISKNSIGENNHLCWKEAQEALMRADVELVRMTRHGQVEMVVAGEIYRTVTPHPDLVRRIVDARRRSGHPIKLIAE